jgi:two-component system response regulator FixJ
MEHEPRVILVDDDANMRGALRYLVESVGLAVEEYENAKMFLQDYSGARPACMVLDMRMPGMSGLDLLTALPERKIEIPVIMITGHGDVSSAVQALHLGAVDFLEKPFNNQALLDRIQQSLESDTAAQLKQQQREEISARFANLTPRERQVLDLIVAGMANKQISDSLNISIKTIHIHRAHLMEKTGASNLAELLKMANLLQD